MLKGIELKGFKSFADRTTVEFNDGITCIVGPNGSGKSNITDAFRWVLGEQRQKTLRAGKMTDVIFGGTTKRDPLSFAEVSVIFDNETGYLPTEYNEVKVTRKLFRSGESAYEINGSACRLKDIRNLFADTGIGVEGYSIIGQGRIDKLLSSDLSDRRLIFDEATGIAKLRIKKDEASRKLAKAEVNIERVEDIISELSTHVEPLKEQMEAAKLYNSLSTELRELEINAFLSDIKVFSDRINEYESSLEDIYSESEVEMSSLLKSKDAFAKLKSESDELKLSKSSVYDKLKSKEEAKLSLSYEIENKKDRVELYREKSEKLRAEIESIDTSGEDPIRSKLLTEAELLEDDFKRLHKIFQAEKDEIDVENRFIEEKYETLALSKADLRAKKDELTELRVEKTKLTAEIESSKLVLEKLEAEKNVSTEKLEKLTDALSEKTVDRNELQKKIQDKKNHILSIGDEYEALKTEVSILSNKIFNKNTAYNNLSSEIEIMKKRVENHDVFVSASKDVISIARRDGDTGIIGSIADLIKVDKKYHLALEQILGTRIENVVCETFDDAKKYIALLKEKKLGRATFMPLDKLNAKEKVHVRDMSGLSGHILDFIEIDDNYEPALRYLLYNVFISEDIEGAKLATDNLPQGAKIVTLDGDVVNVGGTVSGGQKKHMKASILSDMSVLEESEDKLTEKKSEIDRLISEKNRLESKLEHIESSKANLKIDLDELVIQSHKIDAEIDSERKVFSSENSTLEQKKIDIEKLSLLIADALKQSKEIDSNGELIEIEIKRLTSLIEVLDEDASLRNKDLKEKIEALRTKEADTLEIRYELENKKREIADREQLLAEKKTKESELQSDLERTNLDIDNLTKSLNDLNLRFDELSADILSLRENTNDFDEKIRGISSELEKSNEEIQRREKLLSDLKDDIYAVKLKLTKSETRKEVAIKSLWETYNMSLLEAEEFINHDIKNNTKAYRDNLKLQIEELGEVNHLAIEEYEKVSQRYEFLLSQKTDLTETHKKLSSIIDELIKDMSKRFLLGMKSINQNFSDSFKGLFRGGDASIEISDMDNVLESNIIIHAQPPGKKLQTIELLSGGEKSLTAIAILFAILKDKPSPFCILDEIEAALDDNNIYLFSSYLKDFAMGSQFVVITHRKATMEASKSLFGVTMKEKGVSSVFSLSIDDVK